MNNEFGGGRVFYVTKPWPGYAGLQSATGDCKVCVCVCVCVC